jgi:hypothetical protein
MSCLMFFISEPVLPKFTGNLVTSCGHYSLHLASELLQKSSTSAMTSITSPTGDRLGISVDASISPIDVVPVEILGKIFGFYVRDNLQPWRMMSTTQHVQYEVENGPWVLTLVSRLWKDVAVSYGVLWSTVSLKKYVSHTQGYIEGNVGVPPYETGQRRFLEGLRRSQNYDLSITCDGGGVFFRFAPPLLRRAARWKAIRIWDDFTGPGFSQLFPIKDALPRLQILDIYHRGRLTSPISVPALFLKPPPMLHSISLSRFHNPRPQDFVIAWNHVTHFNTRACIQNAPGDPDGFPTSVLTIVKVAKSLTHLVARPFLSRQGQMSTGHQIRTTSRSLTHLSVDSPAALEYLLLPRLRSLEFDLDLPSSSATVDFVHTFLSESGCTLETLHPMCRMDKPDLSTLMSFESMITHLSLDFSWSRDASRYIIQSFTLNAHQPPTNSVFSNLRSLRLWLAEIPFSFSMDIVSLIIGPLLEMLHSRRGHNLAVPLCQFSLNNRGHPFYEMGTLLSEEENVPRSVRDEFRALKEGGLDMLIFTSNYSYLFSFETVAADTVPVESWLD